MKWLDSARARLRLLFARGAAESRMNAEFRFHVEMETDRLMRAKGLAPDEARRRALAAFGGVEKHKEALRDGRGLAWLSGMSLDVLEAQKRVAKSPLSKREIVRRLGTSAAQLYRLLDQTNYRKSVDQLLALLQVLNCDVDLVVRTKTA